MIIINVFFVVLVTDRDRLTFSQTENRSSQTRVRPNVKPIDYRVRPKSDRLEIGRENFSRFFQPAVFFLNSVDKPVFRCVHRLINRLINRFDIFQHRVRKFVE